MAENGAVLPKNDLEVGWITATDDRAAGNRGSSTSTFATTDEAKNGDKTTVSKDPHTTQPNFQSGDVDIDVAAAAGGLSTTITSPLRVRRVEQCPGISTDVRQLPLRRPRMAIRRR